MRKQGTLFFKWAEFVNKGIGYKYAEYDLGSKLIYEHWPNSKYFFPEIGDNEPENNSNTFIRWLIKKPGYDPGGLDHAGGGEPMAVPADGLPPALYGYYDMPL